MKKILFLLLSLIAVKSMAQDIIYHKSNSRIVANVIEISDTEVKYTSWGVPNSDTITLSAKEFDSIHLANFEVYVPPQVSPNGSNDIQQESYDIMDELQKRDGFLVEKKITLKTGKEITLTKGRELNEYIELYNLKGSEKEDLLQQTCPEAYHEYLGALGCHILGGITTTCFAIYGVGGAIMISEGVELSYSWKLITTMLGACSLYLIYVNDDSAKIFNKWSKHMGEDKAELSINISPISFGLTLNF